MPLKRDVAAGLGVVELAVGIPLDETDGHVGPLTHAPRPARKRSGGQPSTDTRCTRAVRARLRRPLSSGPCRRALRSAPRAPRGSPARPGRRAGRSGRRRPPRRAPPSGRSPRRGPRRPLASRSPAGPSRPAESESPSSSRVRAPARFAVRTHRRRGAGRQRGRRVDQGPSGRDGLGRGRASMTAARLSAFVQIAGRIRSFAGRRRARPLPFGAFRHARSSKSAAATRDRPSRSCTSLGKLGHPLREKRGDVSACSTSGFVTSVAAHARSVPVDGVQRRPCGVLGGEALAVAAAARALARIRTAASRSPSAESAPEAHRRRATRACGSSPLPRPERPPSRAAPGSGSRRRPSGVPGPRPAGRRSRSPAAVRAPAAPDRGIPRSCPRRRAGTPRGLRGSRRRRRVR